ncbi:hypothetical protein LWI29_019575 [Acer saccharum]|uniref:Uncharacterized protein n=1 Tax=Acer saccharum TaxID=4024 RepID=A0AA39T2V2_ACESA|nr:hypothetical protein LWI29_019575 [Acer saccharum]
MFPSVKLLQVISRMTSELQRVCQEADKILDSIVNEHTTRKAMGTIGDGEEDDLVDVLLNIQDKGDLDVPLTTENIKAVIQGRCKDREGFILVSEKILELSVRFSLADVFPSIKLLEILSEMTSELEKQHRKAGKIVDNIINEHRERKLTGKLMLSFR